MKKKILILSALLLAAVILSLCAGRYPIGVGDILSICTGSHENEMMRNVFLKIRLPRVVFSVMAGSALGVSGLVYQELFRNPLVSPDVLGVSGGAGVGAVLAIVFGLGTASVTSFALAGGLIAVVLSLILSHFASSGDGVNVSRNVVMVLAGIVVKALCDSAVMAMKYTADPTNQLPTIDYWLMGSLQNVRRDDVLTVLPLCILPMVLLGLMRFRISVLSMGDEDADGLGAEVKLIRYACVVLACVPVAAVTSVTGVISWVGLIVPHVVRRIFGEGIQNSFPLCLLAGGFFMTLVDTAARSVSEAEIPISIVTSCAGAVVLCVFLFRNHRKRGAA